MSVTPPRQPRSMRWLHIPHDDQAALVTVDGSDTTAALQSLCEGRFDCIELPFGDLWVGDDFGIRPRDELNHVATFLCRTYAPANMLTGGAVLGPAVLTGRPAASRTTDVNDE